MKLLTPMRPVSLNAWRHREHLKPNFTVSQMSIPVAIRRPQTAEQKLWRQNVLDLRDIAWGWSDTKSTTSCMYEYRSKSKSSEDTNKTPLESC